MLRWIRSHLVSFGIAAVMLAMLAYENHLRAPHRISIEPILAAASVRGCLDTLHVHSLLVLGAENMAPHQRAQLAAGMARFDADRCAMAQQYLVVPSRETGDYRAEALQNLAERRAHAAEVSARLRAELVAIEEMAQPVGILGRLPDLLRRHRLAENGAFDYLACAYPLAISPDPAIRAAAVVAGIDRVPVLKAVAGIDEGARRLSACLSTEAEHAMVERMISAGYARITPGGLLLH